MSSVSSGSSPSLYGSSASAAWLAAAGSSSSSSPWMETSNKKTTTADQYLALDSAVSDAVASALTNSIQGQATLAGLSALDRVKAAIKHKQASAASAAGTS